MRDRFIFVTNDQRLRSLKSTCNFNDKGIKKGDFLFKLDDISQHEKEMLMELSNTLKPFMKVVVEDAKYIVIKVIPEMELLNQLKNINSESSDINEFIKKVLMFFSTSSSTTKWKLTHGELDFENRPLLMAILNITPDSFSDGGNYIEKNKAVDHALKMIEEGANILDIGGESTRPGAKPVGEDEECGRVIPIIEEIRNHSSIPISIDTYKSKVAGMAIESGADIINDIFATGFDTTMKKVLKKYACPIIVMHKQGNPVNMQLNPLYNDVQENVYNFLAGKCGEIEQLNGGKIIIDPGIGFGKSLNHNLSLIRDIADFTFIGKPVMVGLSRKSFIGTCLDVEINQRLIGSIISEFYSFLNGVGILRVHDVRETVQAKRMIANILAA